MNLTLPRQCEKRLPLRIELIIATLRANLLGQKEVPFVSTWTQSASPSISGHVSCVEYSSRGLYMRDAPIKGNAGDMIRVLPIVGPKK